MILELIIIFIILLVIDSIWLYFVVGPLFGDMINTIQKSSMKVNWVAALISYILLTIGIYHFGYKNIDKDDALKKSLIYGGIFGLIVYGVFDATNLAIFKDYKVGVGLLDTLWGGVVSFIVTYTSFIVINYLKSLKFNSSDRFLIF